LGWGQPYVPDASQTRPAKIRQHASRPHRLPRTTVRYFEEEPDEWQNWSIGSYLEAIAAWLRATPMAQLFHAGSIYE